jgi:hypothetical protein
MAMLVSANPHSIPKGRQSVGIVPDPSEGQISQPSQSPQASQDCPVSLLSKHPRIPILLIFPIASRLLKTVVISGGAVQGGGRIAR